MRKGLLAALVVVGLSACNPGGDEVSTVDGTGGQAGDRTVVVEGLVRDIDVTQTADDVASVRRSADHVATLEQLGAPDRFALQFADGARLETWHYDASGYDVVFRNGVRLYVEEVPPLVVEGLGSTPFEPDRFTRGMSVLDLLAVTGQRSYLEEPLEVVGGRLIVLQGLTAAFDDEGLVSLETIPIQLD
jgi:hypothetical protein